ncbi:MAG: hypothetical protein Q3979_08360 [Actinomycetaceae bacterium]|nr:hypothetical protein [Actinomycetaceae bacterium]
MDKAKIASGAALILALIAAATWYPSGMSTNDIVNRLIDPGARALVLALAIWLIFSGVRGMLRQKDGEANRPGDSAS